MQPTPTPTPTPAPTPSPDDPGADEQVDPAAEAAALNLAYFAFKLGGPEGRAVGLFRIADNEEQQVLTLERFTPAGEWEDDPKLIDDLHEPGVFSVDEEEAQSIQADILSAHDPSQDAAAPPPPA